MIRDASGYPISPDVIMQAYRQRAFPMADELTKAIDWYRPDERAIITWDRFAIPRSLSKVIAQKPYRITVDRAFPEVVAACAERTRTWISPEIIELYTQLHHRGDAHSIEAWSFDNILVGGCYGLAVDGIFSGESMFHRAANAAKICVVGLISLLKTGGFVALDCQQQSPHMHRFGAYEIRDDEYENLCAAAPRSARFPVPSPVADLDVSCVLMS